MPALVNNRVGSLAGKSGLERTRVWPCRSKYCKNFSRISLPVIASQKFSTHDAAGEASGFSVVSEFGFLLSALSFTSRLCVKSINNFSQRRKENPKPQSKLRHYSLFVRFGVFSRIVLV